MLAFGDAISRGYLWVWVVNLPQMVMSSAMDSESVGLVKDYVNELMV